MKWFRRSKPEFTVIAPPKNRDRIPKDLWHKCDKCSAITLRRDFTENLHVCPKCDHHLRLAAPERLKMLVDEGTFVEEDANLISGDPLQFVDQAPYPERIKKHQKTTGRKDAVICGVGNICGIRTSIAVMDFAFSGGSMGSVVGEKVTRTIERAHKRGLPAVVVTCTGGARMQEGILSLMQMAKTSGAISRLHEARLPYISVLTDPSTAGVMASYASLGDIIIAEPETLIGFAGARVIEATIKQVLPRGFQRTTFVKEHGFLDKVAHRKHLKREIAHFLALFLENLPAAGVKLEQDPAEWREAFWKELEAEAAARQGTATTATGTPAAAAPPVPMPEPPTSVDLVQTPESSPDSADLEVDLPEAVRAEELPHAATNGSGAAPKARAAAAGPGASRPGAGSKAAGKSAHPRRST